MNFNEEFAPLGSITSGSYNSEQNTAWVNLSNYRRVAIVIDAGTVGTTLNADVEIATDDNGADIHTLKSITELDDPGQVVINVLTEELSKPVGATGIEYDWLRLEVTPSGSCNFSVMIYGFGARYNPPANNWDEVVD